MDKKTYKPFKQYRLPNYDYSAAGGYFITLCTKNREKHLSTVVEGNITLTEAGEVADKYLSEIPFQFSSVSVDISVIMPEHIHVIFLFGSPLAQGEYEIAFGDNFKNPHVGKSGIPNNPMEVGFLTIGGLMRWYKAKCCYDIKQQTKYPDFAWQPRFHDRIIRNQKELDVYRNYIIDNPQNLHL